MRTSTRLVLFVWLLATAVALFNTVDLLRTHPDTDPHLLHEAVLRQWRALSEGDYAAAYRQASLDIRERYSMEEYAERVRQQFRPIPPGYRIEFGPADIREDRALLRVLFVREGTAAIRCLYHLEKEKGTWRIASVRLAPFAQRGARPPGTRA